MEEEGLIFYPDRLMIGLPTQWGLDFEDIYFPTEDGVALNGWFVPGAKDLTWLWFTGNAGNISYRLDNLKLLHDRLGLNIFIIDYRGYGKSQGKVSEEGTYLDAEAALKYLHSRKDINHDRIISFGRSLGSAVAIDLATKERCLGIILESPFTSATDIMRRIFPFLPPGILSAKYDSLSKIKRVTAPLLVLHGDRDEVIPFELGRKLYEAANEPKEFYTIKGAGHNDTYIVGGEEYIAALQGFIANLS